LQDFGERLSGHDCLAVFDEKAVVAPGDRCADPVQVFHHLDDTDDMAACEGAPSFLNGRLSGLG
jgi:hypothetical protein